ncbi:protein DPCD [Condylostylus longicornis]|uniref:protein DPCD n=1 Tax=Condylostylus longicornis TaxID=2530218 RepID=UPI00244E51A1|nr:protein DPCD [Condylostylus longicornis]
MSFESWINLIKEAEKTSLINGNVRKIHYKFKNGKEMVEEYSLETGVIQRRAWKICKELMGDPVWDIELGEVMNVPLTQDQQNLVVRESNTEPILTKRITKKNIEWRIRNLPYPIDNYIVIADADKKSIIVKTKNKKYYKIIDIPELNRCNTSPDQENITIHHQYSTLIITYKKPKILCEMEVAVLKVLQDVETETDMEDLMKELMQTRNQ